MKTKKLDVRVSVLGILGVGRKRIRSFSAKVGKDLRGA